MCADRFGWDGPFVPAVLDLHSYRSAQNLADGTILGSAVPVLQQPLRDLDTTT
ncbi:hypothetical protein ACFVZW_16255 [Streptomyces sp. NPDC059567]|uniref:hypothetical protein n=1 Tax=Streptomyces sp. NPDC059567 TaxID=3346867 RepID=UPI0036AE1682